MTNHWTDLKNARCFLVGGSNAAENHPLSMRWITAAQREGAKLIVVDPRFTRTAALADIYAQIRPGTDIAYLGAVINYLIQRRLYDVSYVTNYTNALYKVSPDYAFHAGLFSGFHPRPPSYDLSRWAYQTDAAGKPLLAASLDDPECVFQKLKQHYARYDFDTASRITGIPADQIREIAETLAQNRPGTVLYALGMTQHTVGVQNVRSYAILQLLLGNMGRPGGGVNALRGEPNVQGATDFANLATNLSGYVATPTALQASLPEWEATYGSTWTNVLVGLLKAWFGDAATAANDYGYDFLPKIKAGLDPTFNKMMQYLNQDMFRILFNFGGNPMVSMATLDLVREGLPHLETLVVADLFHTETADFWKAPGNDPAQIATEVFFLPVAFSVGEKAGSITNSGRWVQWKEQAVAPAGQAKPDLEILDLIFRRLRELYRGSTAAKDQPILRATWDYAGSDGKPDPYKVLEEINGYDLTTGKVLPDLGAFLTGKRGSVASGCWIYAGVTGQGNLAKRRNTTDPSKLGLYPQWTWAWPANIRILYNRASCDAAGRPVDRAHPLVWWDAAKGTWTGWDVPDVVSPTAAPSTPAGRVAFKMTPEGVGRLFTAPYLSAPKETVVATGPERGKTFRIGLRAAGTVVDGPLPEHYEPWESPVENLLHPAVSRNPLVLPPTTIPAIQKVGTSAKFPYVLTTYTLVEQFCSGAVTRNLPWLNEIMPEGFVEVPAALARQKGIGYGDLVEIRTARGTAQARAMVTERLHALQLGGQPVFVIGMPYNWGFEGLSPGASVNYVTIAALDPGAKIQETKACLCDLRKV